MSLKRKGGQLRKRRQETLLFATTWMKVEDNTPSKISQRQEDTQHLHEESKSHCVVLESCRAFCLEEEGRIN